MIFGPTPPIHEGMEKCKRCGQSLYWHERAYRSGRMICPHDPDEIAGLRAELQGMRDEADVVAKQALDLFGEKDRLIERLTAERDKAMTQRDALFHECEAMRQKTPPCIDCDRLKAEVGAYRRRDRVRVAGLRGFLRWLDSKKVGSFEIRGRLLNHSVITDDEYDAAVADNLGLDRTKEGQ